MLWRLKKNGVVPSGSVPNTEDVKSESDGHSISNSFSEAVGQVKPTPFQRPTFQPQRKIEATEFLINSTKNNFLNNPLFQDSNPNAEKNKDIYINELSKSGADKSKLQTISTDLKKNKELFADASQRANANPNDFTATYDAGTALLGMGKPDDAIAAFRTTLGALQGQGQESDIPLQNELAMNMDMNKSGGLNPANSLFGIGSALSQKGDYKGSVEAYNEALSIDPTNIYAQKGLAYSKYKLGDKEGSKEHLKQAKVLEEANKPFEAMATQIGEEAIAEREQQRQADYMNDIANGMEKAISYPGSVVYRAAKGAVTGFLEGAKKVNEGVSDITAGGHFTDEGGFKTGTVGGGLLKVPAGGLSMYFNTIPGVAAFNAAVMPLADAAEANPDNEGLQIAQDFSTIPFSLYSHIAKWTGHEPTTENQENIAEIMDIVLMVGGHKAGLKGVESVKDLGEKVKQAANKTLPIDEIQKINVLSDYAKNLKLDDVQIALEKSNTPKAKKALADIDKQRQTQAEYERRDAELEQAKIEREKKYAELTLEIEGIAKQGWDARNKTLSDQRDARLNEIQSKRAKLTEEKSIHDNIPDNVVNTIERMHEGKPTDPVALKETKEYLFDEYKRLSELKKDNKRMFTIDQINEAQGRLEAAAKDIDRHSVEQNEMSPELKDLHKQADELQKASGLTPESMNTVQRILAEVNNKIKEQEKVEFEDKIDQANTVSEINDIEGKIKTEQESLKNPQPPEVVKIVEAKIEALNTQKKAAELKFKPLKQPKGLDYSKGKTSVEIIGEENLSKFDEGTFDEHMADYSENPLELATRYLQLDVESAMDMKSHTDQLLDAANIKLTPEEFAKISDKNNIDPFIKSNFLNKKEFDTHYDKKLQEINEVNGTNITHGDLVDYITRAQGESYMPKEVGVRSKFRKKFKELTGQELTPSRAKEIIELEEKKYKLHEKDYYRQEGLSSAELEQHYYEGIKEGRIKPFDNEHFGDVKGNKEGGKGTAEGKGESAGKGKEADSGKQLSIDDRIAELKKKRAESKKPGGSSYAASGFAKLIVEDLPYYTELGKLYVEKYAKLFAENVKEFYNKFREENPELKDATDTDLQPIFKRETTVSDTFHKLTHKEIESSEIKETFSNIERETGRELTKEQKEYEAETLKDAFAHGADVIEKAKIEFGEDYAPQLLEYLDSNKGTLSTAQKSIIQIAIELDLERRIQEAPDNALSLEKQLKLVQDKSIVDQRSAARAVAYGRLRQIARVGYDISKVTEGFFSPKEIEQKKKIEKNLQANADEINKAAHDIEVIEETKKANREKSDKIIEGNKKRVGKKYDDIFESAKRDMVAQKVAKGLEEGKSIEKVVNDLVDAGEIKEKNKRAAVDYFTDIEKEPTTPKELKAELEKLVEKAKKETENIGKAKKEGKVKDVERLEKEKELTDGQISNLLKSLETDAPKEPKAPKTAKEKLATAKEKSINRSNKIREEIINRKREIKEIGRPVQADAELMRLKAEEKALSELRDKYLPKDEALYRDEKALKAVENKLLSDIEKLNTQIIEGERAERAAKKDPLTNESIVKLKAEKKARVDTLESLDPVPKKFIKDALIEQGFGREITVTTKNGKEKRQIIDWKKLAGEEGSIEKIQKNVEKSLKDKGYSPSDILRMQDAFVEEYKALRASIVEKSLNELNNRNTPQKDVDFKSTAQRLAELYDYGLFEKEHDTYDYLMNKALGLDGIGQSSFFKAKELAEALSELYNKKVGIDNRKISEFGVKHAIRTINEKIEKLVSDVAWQQSGKGFKLAQGIKEYMGLSQRAMLTSVKQGLENPLSGHVERAYQKLGFSFDNMDTKALQKNRGKIAKMIYEDIVRNGGLVYGEIITPLLSKTKTEQRIINMSDSKIYHTIASGMMGRSFLEAADSMHKAVLTEKYFTYNLVKVLQAKGMSKMEATTYVSEQLTGQTLADAMVTAKEIIDKVNKGKTKKILPDNIEAVNRLANDIVKDALIEGKKLSLKEIEASYDAAYKAAGYGLGHEANNPISHGVNLLSTKFNNDLNKAIKEKNWPKAAALTWVTAFNRSVLNPFVGGGTNWMVLTAQKAFLDPISPLWHFTMREKVDLTTERGMRNLENALLSNLKAKTTNVRMVNGAAAALITFAAVKATGLDDTFDTWLKKNTWAEKYFAVLAPQALIAILASKNDEMEHYFANLLGQKYTNFSDMGKVVQAFGYAFPKKEENEKKAAIKNEKNEGKASAKIGEVVGGKFQAPVIPWRLAKDVQDIYRGVTGKPKITVDYNSKGFIEGYFKQGLIGYINNNLIKENTEEPKEEKKSKVVAHD